MNKTLEYLTKAKELAEEEGLDILITVVNQEIESSKPGNSKFTSSDEETPINQISEPVECSERTNGIKKEDNVVAQRGESVFFKCLI